MANIYSLYEQLVKEIFSYLPEKDMINISKVCKSWWKHPFTQSTIKRIKKYGFKPRISSMSSGNDVERIIITHGYIFYTQLFTDKMKQYNYVVCKAEDPNYTLTNMSNKYTSIVYSMNYKIDNTSPVIYFYSNSVSICNQSKGHIDLCSKILTILDEIKLPQPRYLK